jgi:hypothetical protein
MYPKPDRSNYTPNFHKTAADPALDIGWNEGLLSDGRPYRVEAWCEQGVTALTYFLSTRDLENMTNQQFADLLEKEELVCFQTERRSVAAMPFTDDGGNEMWSINLVVGGDDDEHTFVEDLVPLRKYHRPPTGA